MVRASMRIKAIALILTVTALVTLTGCDATNLPPWVAFTDSPESVIQDRVGANLRLLNTLVESGLVSEDEAEQIKRSLEAIKENPGTLGVGINNAISWYLKVSLQNSEGSWRTETTYHASFQRDTTGDGGKEIDSSYVKALDLVGSNQYKVWNNLVSYKICVLNSQPTNPVSVEEIHNLLNAAKSKSGAERDSAFNELITKGYFKETNLTPFDPNSPDYALIAETKPIKEYETYPVYDTENGNKVGMVRAKAKQNDIGYDLTLTYDGVPVVTLRIKEFNREAIQRLIGAEGISKDVFLVDTKNARVFLVEYPVYYIESVSIDENGSYKTNFAKSDLKLNLLTGKIKDKDGKELGQTEVIISASGKTNGFMVYGEADIENVGYKNETVKGGRIVLRDYLELSYMPGIVQGENFVALGRRVRVENFVGNQQTKFASFIDKNGEVIPETPPILISHLMDITSGEDGKSYKLGIVEQQEEEPIEGEPIPDNSKNVKPDTHDDNQGMTEDLFKQRLLLEPVYKNEIRPTTRFPGDIVCRSGLTSDSNDVKMILYGIAVDLNPFETGLYNGWILRDDPSGGLMWWNRWLNSPPYVYNYQIDPEALKQFFMGNYSFEIMKRENIIVLNLHTLAKIQEQYNADDKAKSVNSFRTIFAIIGIALLAYGIVLLAAWVFDVNLITGPRLMSILTLGKWEAIASTDEMPEMETGEKHYMTFGKTLNSSIIIMCIGVTLLFVDIIAIVKQLLEIFGGIGEWISRVIFR